MTRDDDKFAAVKRVEDSMSRFADEYRRSVRVAATTIDAELSPLGFRIVLTLVRRGAQTSGALAERFDVDPSVISRQLRQVEGLGLVVNSIDPNDRRCRVVDVTAEGRARISALPDGLVVLSSVLAAWSSEDLERFASYIDRLALDADPDADPDADQPGSSRPPGGAPAT